MSSKLRQRIAELKKAHRPEGASSKSKQIIHKKFISGFVESMKEVVTDTQLRRSIDYLETTGFSLHVTPDAPPTELKRKINRQGMEGLRATEEAPDGHQQVFCPITDLTILGVAVLQSETTPELVYRFAQYLAYLAIGLTHKKLMVLMNVTWRELRSLYIRYEVTQAAVREISEMGEDFRRLTRLEAAHERAVEGIEENIYTASGRLCGTRRVYSDKLLTLLLKGDDPDRFSTTQQKVDIKEKVTVVINTGFDREKLLSEEEKAKELEGTHPDWERLPVASIVEGEKI